MSGKTQCSTDIPSSTLRARSAIECSLRCDGLLEECCAFNFIKEELSCELFDNVTSSNCTEMSGCTLYTVRKLFLIKYFLGPIIICGHVRVTQDYGAFVLIRA